MSERLPPKAPREEFPAAVKRDAWARCGGRCDGCGRDLVGVKHVYDHDVPTRLGGPPTLENCRVLCDDGKHSCNYRKTHVEDLPGMAARRRYGKNRLPLDIERQEKKPGSIKGRGFGQQSRPMRSRTTFERRK